MNQINLFRKYSQINNRIHPYHYFLIQTLIPSLKIFSFCLLLLGKLAVCSIFLHFKNFFFNLEFCLNETEGKLLLNRQRQIHLII